MAKLDKGKPKPNGKGKTKAAGPAHSSKGKQRQRDEAEQVADPVEEAAAAPSIDLDKVAKKMHHTYRQLYAAAKRANKFEILRIMKRHKQHQSTATSTSSSTATSPQGAEAPTEDQRFPYEVRLEIGRFKVQDLDIIAALALFTKLGKAKLLPKGAAADAYKTQDAKNEMKGVDEWPLMHGIWKSDVLSLVWTIFTSPNMVPGVDRMGKERVKLLSSKIVAEESAKAVEALKKLVSATQEQKADESAKAATSKEPAKSNGETSAASTKAKAAKTKEEPDREWSGSEDEEEEAAGASEGESDDESDEEDEGLDEEAIQERVAQLGDLDQWDHLIGGSGSDEGEDDDDEEGSSGEGDAAPREVAASTAPDAKKRKRSASPEAQRKGKKKVAVAAPVPAKASSSDSDGSDDDDDDDSASDAESSASSSSSSSSRYLPTLSHGFVTQSLRTRDDDFSGSEDEGDYDFEEDVEDHLPKGKGTKASNGAAKKNRMGQRARKALWEKKYGRNANHVKLREKEKSKGDKPAYKPLRRGRDGKVLEEFVEPERKDSGWKRFPVKDEEKPASPKAASSSRAPLPPQGSHRGAPPSRPPRQQQQQRPPPPAHRPRGPAPPSAASDAAAMHPSWVAKQKQKEKEEAIARSLAGGGGGAGKKVVFD